MLAVGQASLPDLVVPADALGDRLDVTALPRPLPISMGRGDEAIETSAVGVGESPICPYDVRCTALTTRSGWLLQIESTPSSIRWLMTAGSDVAQGWTESPAACARSTVSASQ